MSKLTKKQKILVEKVDPEKTFSVSEALEIMQSVKSAKFEESVDLNFQINNILKDKKNSMKLESLYSETKQNFFQRGNLSIKLENFYLGQNIYTLYGGS